MCFGTNKIGNGIRHKYAKQIGKILHSREGTKRIECGKSVAAKHGFDIFHSVKSVFDESSASEPPALIM